MRSSSIRYIDTSYMYEQPKTVKPSTNPVVYGRFPKKYVQKKSYIENVNKFLSTVLMGFVLLSFVSYYFVSDGEKVMNNLCREIVALSNENIELQNKLDNLHAFNKVDSIIHNNTVLDTAKKVIEVPAVEMASIPQIPSPPVNYRWNMGY